jgi:lipopolysaccharide export system permease protein
VEEEGFMLLDTAVRTELARNFGGVLVVILTVELTMMLVRTIGLAASGAVAPQDVAMLLGYTALMHLPTTLSLSLFIAVVATLGRMYRDSEMTVWFACGVGLLHFVRPVLRMSWPVLVLIAALILVVSPWSHHQSQELRKRYQERGDLARVAPGMFQASRDGRRVIFIEGTEGQDASRAHNVFILDGDSQREAVVSAQSGRVVTEGEQRMLLLEHGQRNDLTLATGASSLARFDSYRVAVSELPGSHLQERSPETLPTLALLRQPGPRQQAELAWRFGLLLGAGNLLLLGIGLSQADIRRAGSWNLLFALLSFFVYYNAINLSKAWVAAGRLGLPGALLGLHGLVLSLALALLWWRERGTAMPLPTPVAKLNDP